MGVQLMGSLLNKLVSTGDDLWGVRWRKIPDPLRCYALGDIKLRSAVERYIFSRIRMYSVGTWRLIWLEL